MSTETLHIATEQPGTADISQLEALLEEHPYFTAAWVKLLLEYRALGKEDKVRELLTKVAAMAPDRSILKKRLEAVLLLKAESKSTVGEPAPEAAGVHREREEAGEKTPLAGALQEDKEVQPEEDKNASAVGGNEELKSGEVHSFTEWLHYLQEQGAEEEEEEKEEMHAGEEELIIDAGALHEARYQMEAAKLAEAEESGDEEEEDEALSDADLDRAREMAAQSLAMDESLISETLAKVYVIQGKKEKAIEIYQRLIEKMPEKSAYFSAQIKKLKGS